MQTILITGGTGLVGKKLTKLLVLKGYNVIVLTRTIPVQPAPASVSYALWDVKKQTIDVKAVQQADAIVHLAGAGVVDKRWTDAYKKEIVDSRTKSSELLIQTLKNNPHKISTIVSASAIGWYGADQREGFAFTENDPAAPGFLGNTCQLWEQSIEPDPSMNIRLCKLRTGIVLSNDGGALAEFKKPIHLGVAAILGSGQQMVSWIHIEDLCRMFVFAIENNNMQGSFNAAAPMPVSNKTLTLTLAKAMKGSFYIPLHVPAFILKIMLGESSIEVLKSTTVSAKKIADAGFTFTYPSIDAAVNELVRK
jgi:uncharacterized protein (TIGR01777 family)